MARTRVLEDYWAFMNKCFGPPPNIFARPINLRNFQYAENFEEIRLEPLECGDVCVGEPDTTVYSSPIVIPDFVWDPPINGQRRLYIQCADFQNVYNPSKPITPMYGSLPHISKENYERTQAYNKDVHTNMPNENLPQKALNFDQVTTVLIDLDQSTASHRMQRVAAFRQGHMQMGDLNRNLVNP